MEIINIYCELSQLPFTQLLLNFDGDIPQSDLNHEEKYCWSEKDIFSAISEIE